jgi:hypothetical protein
MKKIGIFSFLFPFLFMILMSANKLTKNIYFLRHAKFLFLHFLFFLFLFYFIFFLFWGLGPAQPTWAGLDPADLVGSLVDQ